MEQLRQPPVEYKHGAFRPLLILFLLAALIPLYLASSNIAEEQLNEAASQHLARIYNGLSTTLARHIYLPALLAEQNAVKNYLSDLADGHTTNPDAVNRYLEKSNHIAGTSDIYLMTPHGTTVAASNWNLEQTFIGKNFSFRPYFQEAMQGKLGRYYALGSTSKARGYYFSRPVYDGNNVTGVVTTKISISDFEENWPDEKFEFIVTGPDEMVFLSSNSQWRLRPLEPLSSAQEKALRESRRYGKVKLDAIGISQKSRGGENALHWRIGKSDYLVQSRIMNTANWTVSVLAPTTSVTNFSVLVTSIGLVVLLLAGLLLGVWWQRQAERRLFEIRAREELETKVEQRTAELRLAQENLVQAAKMAALGELAAGINHELNNPLTAIRAYADNATQFLAHGDSETVETNLGEITKLTERMAAITHQLKSFSRKSQGEIVCVDLSVAVENALAILHPRLSRISDAVVEWTPPDSKPYAMADLIWVEQILVNLLTNAVEAIQNREQPKIHIAIRRQMKPEQKDTICLSVRDNGPGIDTEVIPNLFEPFFTTKSVGKGLGLGLSISYRLAKEMGGTLEARNHEDGGAVFTLTLPTSGKMQ
ncbi:sensor histidine kinase [Solemya velum gill symbiont]|uniref:C4-dicarboxylate transport sensor protein DctB n=1 Tax=Solemya velum gill symbiont TaxID=2340 RepID=A0A0B0H617_SOVGS|nr:ATP-binding protein [Solemya velum gill symbiont]KHF25653.1 signal transduction histidine kinase [Solemya velum gill symbiont]OOY35742.1 hypothetical protein BOV88_03640 [Solemya velum gill symbiont]OOY38370.1 hypothetical protein BOV89_02905 [Solemya velum gill symbiont]OOY40968.1 hypothetical protein BOV90_01260 [Solemya velum gill symbiont]OOY43498.1 hypothetical protein BOV92_11090 [Solemya velum gill symbiont]